MSGPSFDPAKAITFDLSRGQVADAARNPRVLVPAAALFSLCSAAGADAAASFARAIGDAIGAAVASRFEAAGMSTNGAAIDEVVEQLGGELGVAGFGVLSAERWGRGLVLVVDHAPGEADRLLEAVLAAAVGRAAGAQVRCVRLAREGQRVRFLVTGAAGADKVGAWLREGVSWGEALVRLHPSENAVSEAT
jgi:hypothetical protein